MKSQIATSRRKEMINMSLVPVERIEAKILLIRGKKVMLDRDLADLYGVKTKALNQAVRRNTERFPSDFMFQLTKKEMRNWRSQFVTSKKEAMGIRRRPYAFTEPGVAMLSSVLNSKRAIQTNIQIIKTFIRLRELLSSHIWLRQKIEEMEKKYDRQFAVIFDVIKKLLEPPKAPEKRIIGFKPQ